MTPRDDEPGEHEEQGNFDDTEFPPDSENNPERRYAQASVLKTQVETIASTDVESKRSGGLSAGKLALIVLIAILALLAAGVVLWNLAEEPAAAEGAPEQKDQKETETEEENTDGGS